LGNFLRRLCLPKKVKDLFALLNSNTSKKILNAQLKSKNEKDMLVSTSSIKKYIRVPNITNKNKKGKEKIITLVKELLELDGKKLTDFIDFKHILAQKFDDVYIESNKLVLVSGNKKNKLTVKSNLVLISNVVGNLYGGKRELFKGNVILNELKQTRVVDLIKQQKIRDEIDELVGDLYFKI
ncbi:hypothetical protein ACFLUS_03465, partial [Chloroflexota bacterium]